MGGDFKEGRLFKDDSWSNWQPDPERAFRDHDPALEPYTSMSKEEILGAMLDARGGREWEFLREFLLDKCSEEERHQDRFIQLLACHGEIGRDEICYLNEIAGRATRLIP